MLLLHKSLSDAIDDVEGDIEEREGDEDRDNLEAAAAVLQPANAKYGILSYLCLDLRISMASDTVNHFLDLPPREESMRLYTSYCNTHLHSNLSSHCCSSWPVYVRHIDSVLIILSLSYMKEERGRIKVIMITIVGIIVYNTSNIPKLSAASQITPAYKDKNDNND